MQYSNKSIWNNAKKRASFKTIVVRQLWNRIGDLEDAMQYNNEDLEARISELEKSYYDDLALDVSHIERHIELLEDNL